ncbi:MAG: hypothetical protein ACM34K_16895 [Bacillota bacterium]
MYSIDRHLVIIKPKQPFLDWLKSLAEENSSLVIEDIRHDNTAFMIPSNELIEQDQKYIKSIFPDLFEMELEEWSLDTDLWPGDRTYELFQEWFDTEIHTIVIDTLEDPVEKSGFSMA